MVRPPFRNSGDFAMYLLNTAHVSSVMGDTLVNQLCSFFFLNSMHNIEKRGNVLVTLAKLKCKLKVQEIVNMALFSNGTGL